MSGPWEAYQKRPAQEDGPWSAYAKPKAAAGEKIDPTEGMSTFDKAAAGAGKAVMDLYRGGKQLLGLADQAEIDEAKRLDAPLMNTGAGIAGNVLGNVVATAIPLGGIARAGMAVPAVAGAVRAATAARPIATAMGLGAATGAATGALEPVATGGSRAGNMAAGAAFGAAGGAIPGALARVVKPSVSDEAALLMKEGVRLTPGQVLGGAAKTTEEKIASVPVLGDMIRRAQTRSMEDFNRAGFNRALAPIGEKVGPKFNIGREGVAAVESKIGAAYDKVLDKIGRVDLDDVWRAEVGKITAMADELGDDAAKQFRTILNNRVYEKMTPASTMSADTMKEVESVLGMKVRGFMGSADPNQRQLGAAIREVQSSLRRALERTAGPELAGELKNANSAWANFVRIQDAAGRQGAKEGVFTPAQLSAGVRAQDKSVRKGAFARGDALMQDLSDAGKKSMSPEVPDSGTPGRLMAALVGGAYFEPMHAAMAALGTLPYTNLGGKLTLALLAKRPEFAGQLADILRAGAPAGAVASGLMAPSLTGP